MSTDEGGSGPIFPLVDRPAPLLERLQSNIENQSREGVQKAGEDVGRELAAIYQEEDEEVAQELAKLLRAGVIKGVADELNVDPTELEEDKMNEVLAELEMAEDGEDEE